MHRLSFRLRLRFALALLLLPLVGGCHLQVYRHSNSFSNKVETVGASGWPEAHQMLFRYELRDGHAALTTERAVLVFHGLSTAQQEVFHFQGTQQAIQIAGPGRSTVVTTCTSEQTTVTFRSEYADGTNTLQLGEQVVRLACGGRLLLSGEHSVNLGEGRRVVHLKQNKLALE